MVGIWFYNNQVLTLAEHIPEEVWNYQIYITEIGVGPEDAVADQQDFPPFWTR